MNLRYIYNQLILIQRTFIPLVTVIGDLPGDPYETLQNENHTMDLHLEKRKPKVIESIESAVSKVRKYFQTIKKEEYLGQNSLDVFTLFPYNSIISRIHLALAFCLRF